MISGVSSVPGATERCYGRL